jgi:hypothetical protein
LYTLISWEQMLKHQRIEKDGISGRSAAVKRRNLHSDVELELAFVRGCDPHMRFAVLDLRNSTLVYAKVSCDLMLVKAEPEHGFDLGRHLDIDGRRAFPLHGLLHEL